MPQFKALITTTGIGTAGNDLLLVLTNDDNLESVSHKIQTWAEEEYHGNVITSTGKLNNSNRAYVSDINAEKYDKVILL